MYPIRVLLKCNIAKHLQNTLEGITLSSFKGKTRVHSVVSQITSFLTKTFLLEMRENLHFCAVFETVLLNSLDLFRCFSFSKSILKDKKKTIKLIP